MGKIITRVKHQPTSNVTWAQVGSWSTESGLVIKDIVWPDNSHVPPPGVPEKFHIRTGGEMLLKIRRKLAFSALFCLLP